MNLLGALDTAVERALVGSQRRIELAPFSLQHRQVVPSVRQRGPVRQQFLVGGDRLGHVSLAIEQQRLSQQGLMRFLHLVTHAPQYKRRLAKTSHRCETAAHERHTGILGALSADVSAPAGPAQRQRFIR
jgi:hypothetical protein